MKEMLSLVAEAAGWIGALSTAAAYALVSRRRIEPDSAAFQSLNLLGAALLAVSAASTGSWPSVTANFVWILIGVQALVSARRVLGAAADHVDDCLRTRLAPAAGHAGDTEREPAAVPALHPVAAGEVLAASRLG
ncbi:CBU_0592 family membrane protein [Streptomyces sp. NPDC054784]